MGEGEGNGDAADKRQAHMWSSPVDCMWHVPYRHARLDVRHILTVPGHVLSNLFTPLRRTSLRSNRTLSPWTLHCGGLMFVLLTRQGA